MRKVDIWLVVGARRWARVMIDELCQMVPIQGLIYLQGPLGDVDLHAWWSASSVRHRVRIVERAPCCDPSMNGVAFIVGPAHQHRQMIQDALTQGYNVVSEKPLTLSQRESTDLIALANTLGLRLFATNTYLFADYLHVFRTTWLQGRTVSKVDIHWSDALEETRHGEKKSYDSSVPIILDVLPHIANIILATLTRPIVETARIAVHQGGSEVHITYKFRELDLNVQLIRNATRRFRFARFRGEEIDVAIDFSTEPGLVTCGAAPPVCADPDWHDKRKPIAEMLNSVRDSLEFGNTDERLSSSAGVFGNELIDSVLDDYVKQMLTFLKSEESAHSAPATGDLAYARKESQSIAERGLPFLASDSALRLLASGTAILPVDNHCPPFN